MDPSGARVADLQRTSTDVRTAVELTADEVTADDLTADDLTGNDGTADHLRVS